jgi:pyruvate, water dikinase
VIATLIEALDRGRFGGKAVELGASIRDGLPVPNGIALSVEIVEAIAFADAQARSRCAEAVRSIPGPWAVRSSAVDEDGKNASFAGQHVTHLNAMDDVQLFAAITAVWGSAKGRAARAYRAKLGLSEEAKIAVVVQTLVRATASGVLFTRHPVTRADERVVEAAWGLGEAVVAGLVDPDRFRFARGGRMIEETISDKEVEVRPLLEGGTETVEVDPRRRKIACIERAQLLELDRIASVCETAFGGAVDLEFCLGGNVVYLLQRRAVTR